MALTAGDRGMSTVLPDAGTITGDYGGCGLLSEMVPYAAGNG